MWWSEYPERMRAPLTSLALQPPMNSRRNHSDHGGLILKTAVDTENTEKYKENTESWIALRSHLWGGPRSFSVFAVFKARPVLTAVSRSIDVLCLNTVAEQAAGKDAGAGNDHRDDLIPLLRVIPSRSGSGGARSMLRPWKSARRWRRISFLQDARQDFVRVRKIDRLVQIAVRAERQHGVAVARIGQRG